MRRRAEAALFKFVVEPIVGTTTSWCGWPRERERQREKVEKKRDAERESKRERKRERYRRADNMPSNIDRRGHAVNTSESKGTLPDVQIYALSGCPTHDCTSFCLSFSRARGCMFLVEPYKKRKRTRPLFSSNRESARGASVCRAGAR